MVLTFISLSSFTFAYAKPNIQPVSANENSFCPEGNYFIDFKDDDQSQPICKLIPTGCPYGDSIPMDVCDKFKPQDPQPLEPINDQQPIEAIEYGGK